MYYSLRSPYMYKIYFYLINSTVSHQPVSLSTSSLLFIINSPHLLSPVCAEHTLMDVGLSNGSWVASQPVVTSPEKNDPSFSKCRHGDSNRKLRAHISTKAERTNWEWHRTLKSPRPHPSNVLLLARP